MTTLAPADNTYDEAYADYYCNLSGMPISERNTYALGYAKAHLAILTSKQPEYMQAPARTRAAALVAVLDELRREDRARWGE